MFKSEKKNLLVLVCEIHFWVFKVLWQLLTAISKLVLTSLVFFRLCLLGTNCDMFEYSPGSCKFMPHNSLKSQNLFRTIIKDSLGVKSIYILQCSTPYENVLRNNDPFTNSYDGAFLKINWLVKYVFFVKNNSKCLRLKTRLITLILSLIAVF